jgi:hypothetical protein
MRVAPECGADVFFYRSPYNGRVYFNALGWPWPKHGSTDNGRESRRTTRGSTEQRNGGCDVAAGWLDSAAFGPSV